MFEKFKIPKDLIPSDPRFGSGPSLLPLEFVRGLEKTGFEYLGTSHRKSKVKNIVKEMQEGLREFFLLPEDYIVAIGNGGATLLFDMIGLGLVEKNQHILLVESFQQNGLKLTTKYRQLMLKIFL